MSYILSYAQVNGKLRYRDARGRWSGNSDAAYRFRDLEKAQHVAKVARLDGKKNCFVNKIADAPKMTAEPAPKAGRIYAISGADKHGQIQYLCTYYPSLYLIIWTLDRNEARLFNGHAAAIETAQKISEISDRVIVPFSPENLFAWLGEATA